MEAGRLEVFETSIPSIANLISSVNNLSRGVNMSNSFALLKSASTRVLLYVLGGILGVTGIAGLTYLVAVNSMEITTIAPTPVVTQIVTPTEVPTSTTTVSPTISPTTTVTETPITQMTIYLAQWNNTGTCQGTCVTNYIPVDRETTSTDLYSFAMDMLIAGPTESEKASNIFTPLIFSGESHCGGPDYTLSRVGSTLNVYLCKYTDVPEDPYYSGAYAGISLAAMSRAAQHIKKNLIFGDVDKVNIYDYNNECYAISAGNTCD